MGFTKLFSDIVASSIWNEDDKTRIVWITILAIKGANHIARCTIGGLAHQARVSPEDCKRAIDKLTNPDPDGMDQPEQGCRIRAVEHGWLVLNGEAYKLRRDDDERREYQRIYHQEYRRKQSVNKRKHSSTDVIEVNPSDQIRSEADQKEEQLNKSFALSGDSEKPKGRKLERQPQDWETFKAYCLSKGCTNDQATYFFTTWKAAGWKTNGKPMEDWRSKVISWKTQGYGLNNNGKRP